MSLDFSDNFENNAPEINFPDICQLGPLFTVI